MTLRLVAHVDRCSLPPDTQSYICSAFDNGIWIFSGRLILLAQTCCLLFCITMVWLCLGAILVAGCRLLRLVMCCRNHVKLRSSSTGISFAASALYTSARVFAVNRREPHFYVDDTQVFYFNRKDIDGIKEMINTDFSIALDHSLSLKPIKSKIVLFGSSISPADYSNFSLQLDIKIDDKPVELVTSAKNLGLLIDNKL